MTLERQHEEFLESARRERDYVAREEEREAYEAQTALDMAFEERAGCGDACFATSTHTAACMAGAADPVMMAVNGWLASQRIAPQMAQSDEVTSLRFAGGTYRQIAEATGLTVSAVTRICRAEAA